MCRHTHPTTLWLYRQYKIAPVEHRVWPSRSSFSKRLKEWKINRMVRWGVRVVNPFTLEKCSPFIAQMVIKYSHFGKGLEYALSPFMARYNMNAWKHLPRCNKTGIWRH